MRLVLDTNTVISGLLWQGAPGGLIDAAQGGTLSLFTSAALLAELRGVLSRRKFAAQLETRALRAAEILEGYAALATIVAPAIIAPVVAKDPTDDAVLACALAAQADLVVSGDSDLLDLKSYHGIPIIGAAEALERIAQGAKSGPS